MGLTDNTPIGVPSNPARFQRTQSAAFVKLPTPDTPSTVPTDQAILNSVPRVGRVVRIVRAGLPIKTFPATQLATLERYAWSPPQLPRHPGLRLWPEGLLPEGVSDPSVLTPPEQAFLHYWMDINDPSMVGVDGTVTPKGAGGPLSPAPGPNNQLLTNAAAPGEPHDGWWDFRGYVGLISAAEDIPYSEAGLTFAFAFKPVAVYNLSHTLFDMGVAEDRLHIRVTASDILIYPPSNSPDSVVVGHYGAEDSPKRHIALVKVRPNPDNPIYEVWLDGVKVIENTAQTSGYPLTDQYIRNDGTLPNPDIRFAIGCQSAEDPYTNVWDSYVDFDGYIGGILVYRNVFDDATNQAICDYLNNTVPGGPVYGAEAAEEPLDFDDDYVTPESFD